ncbi:hypothetical protein MPSEU_000791300 [Mayamaea pseudoterrestris]|nr:hypothetical protein MPSEU_000791300 [Mayamaea pseudoterrestris]
MASTRTVFALSSSLLPKTVSRQIVRSRIPEISQNALSIRAAFAPQTSMRFLSDYYNTDKKDEAAAAATDNDSQEPPPESTTVPPEIVSKEEELEAQVKELKDQLLRSLAEQDNTRRIAQRDVQDARQYAIKSFAKSLLDVSDNLTRALESVPKEALDDKEANPVLGSLYEGIHLTEMGLNKAFESNGLVKYGNVGDKFDPNQHEALMQYPDPSKNDGVVGQVMKKGFSLNKRVLRPAEVGIIKNN